MAVDERREPHERVGLRGSGRIVIRAGGIARGWRRTSTAFPDIERACAARMIYKAKQRVSLPWSCIRALSVIPIAALFQAICNLIAIVYCNKGCEVGQSPGDPSL